MPSKSSKYGQVDTSMLMKKSNNNTDWMNSVNRTLVCTYEGEEKEFTITNIESSCTVTGNYLQILTLKDTKTGKEHKIRQNTLIAGIIASLFDKGIASRHNENLSKVEIAANLYTTKNMSVEEIANEMNLPVTTITVYLNRGNKSGLCNFKIEREKLDPPHVDTSTLPTKGTKGFIDWDKSIGHNIMCSYRGENKEFLITNTFVFKNKNSDRSLTLEDVNTKETFDIPLSHINRRAIGSLFGAGIASKRNGKQTKVQLISDLYENHNNSPEDIAFMLNYKITSVRSTLWAGAKEGLCSYPNRPTK